MKFEIEAEELTKVLGAMARITSKAKIDSLQNVCILPNNNMIRLIATDMNVALQWDLPAYNIEGEGILYNLQMLLAIVSRQTGIITIDNNVIKAKKSKYKINVGDVVNFPQLDFAIDSSNAQDINYNNLKTAISKTSYATQKVLGVLSGIYFNKNEVVATDANRLVIAKMDNFNQDVIISKTFADEIIKLPFAEDIVFSIKDKKVIISDANKTLVGSILAGTFPKYEQLLPKNFEHQIIFKSSEMLEAINLITPLINTNMVCKIIIDDKKITLAATIDDEEANTDFEVINSDIEEPITIGFNASYLLEMIKSFNIETITMKMNNPKHAVIFESEENFALVMPVVLTKN